MTRAQLKSAEWRMKQQWHDLVMAEQAGEALDVLEQMYDHYILLAEEYNACLSAYQQRRQPHTRPAPLPAQESIAGTGSGQGKTHDAKLAS